MSSLSSTLTQQQLGGSVPHGDYAVGEAVGLAVAGHGEGAGEAEVADLEEAVLRDEDVGALHVSVQDLAQVQVVQPVEQLAQDA